MTYLIIAYGLIAIAAFVLWIAAYTQQPAYQNSTMKDFTVLNVLGGLLAALLWPLSAVVVVVVVGVVKKLL